MRFARPRRREPARLVMATPDHRRALPSVSLAQPMRSIRSTGCFGLIRRRHFSSTPPRHQSRRHAGAQATEGFIPGWSWPGFSWTALLNHSLLYLVGLCGFLWPSRPKSPQIPEASKLGPPAFPRLDIFPRAGPAVENPPACSEPIRRFGAP